MTPDEVLEAFMKLPLPVRMNAAADVVDEANRRMERSLPVEERNKARWWSPMILRQNAEILEIEDAKAADVRRIRSELTGFIRSTGWTGDGSEWVADALLDRFPHIAEGWPTE